jgi:hypothetical protein
MWQGICAKFHGNLFTYSSNINVKTATISEAAVLTILMPLRWLPVTRYTCQVSRSLGQAFKSY